MFLPSCFQTFVIHVLPLKYETTFRTHEKKWRFIFAYANLQPMRGTVDDDDDDNNKRSADLENGRDGNSARTE